jgi:predicted glutamine amidotransferase
MCRLSAIIQLGEQKATPLEIKQLLISMEDGGRDATGIAFIMPDDIIYAKQKGKASAVISGSFENDVEMYSSKSNAIILHTRASTHGSPDNNDNNHPIIGDKYILVHNGIVHTDRKYPAKGETDSEQMLRSIEFNGIEKGLTKCSGWVATIFADITNLKDFYWFSNPTATMSAGLDKERDIWFIASTYSIITKSVIPTTIEYSIAKNSLYKCDLSTGKITIDSNPVVKQNYYSYSSSSWDKWDKTKKQYSPAYGYAY